MPSNPRNSKKRDRNDESVSNETPKAKSEKSTIDYSKFTQQQLMELLASEWEPSSKKEFQDRSGKWLPINQWKGLEFDERNNVIRICWENMLIEGPLDVALLPRTLEKFCAFRNNFYGNNVCRNLPPKLRILDLYANGGMYGSINLGALPRTMEQLILSKNSFTSLTGLRKFPPKMQHFAAVDNSLKGPLDLRHLPRTMARLELRVNQYKDNIFIGNLPDDFFVELDWNNFDASAIVRNCSYSGAKVVEGENNIAWLQVGNRKLASVSGIHDD